MLEKRHAIKIKEFNKLTKTYVCHAASTITDENDERNEPEPKEQQQRQQQQRIRIDDDNGNIKIFAIITDESCFDLIIIGIVVHNHRHTNLAWPSHIGDIGLSPQKSES